MKSVKYPTHLVILAVDDFNKPFKLFGIYVQYSSGLTPALLTGITHGVGQETIWAARDKTEVNHTQASKYTSLSSPSVASAYVIHLIIKFIII